MHDPMWMTHTHLISSFEVNIVSTFHLFVYKKALYINAKRVATLTTIRVV